MNTYAYPGDELTLFAHAHNWKGYFAHRIGGALRGRVLEVGAGLGETTRVLCDGRQSTWLCLEPDPDLAAKLRAQVATLSRPTDSPIEVVAGTVATLPPDRMFDAILYIDVLEHIEHDAEELRQALAHLAPGGALIVLAPAHMALFSPFDQAIGHFRRYDRRSLRACVPPGLEPQQLIYLDSVGMFCSLANRWLLRKSQPAVRDILFWDRALVPLSRVLDPVLRFSLGRSVLGIWRRPATGAGSA